jgi:hypothetical protein
MLNKHSGQQVTLYSFRNLTGPLSSGDTARRRSVANVDKPPAKIVAAGCPDAPPDPATRIAAIGRLRSDRDPDGHGRRRDRPARIPTPAPAAIPTAAAPTTAPAPACATVTPAAAPSGPAPTAASPAAATKTTAAMEGTAVKSAAAMKLGLGRCRDRRDRRCHPKGGNGRNHSLPDRIPHRKIPPLVGPVSRILRLKLCHDGKSSSASPMPRAEN